MRYHRGLTVQVGVGLGSIFSSLFWWLVPVAKGAAKTIGKIAKNEGVRSAGRYLKKEAGWAAIGTALEALDGKVVRAAAKKRLKSATRNILLAGKASRSAQASKRPVKRKNSTHAVGSGKRRKTKQKPLFYVDDADADAKDDY